MAENNTSIVGTSAINMQNLLNLLVKQIQYQDPSAPMKNEEFMAQMAQFAALEQQRETNLRIDRLASAQTAAALVGMLGKDIDANLSEESTASGTVTGIVGFDSGTPKVAISNKNDPNQTVGIALGQIVRLQNNK
ncbi:MAG TPA: flagellar hook capping FlgD N-terminal domain-containing protein [Paucimonas sp.]|nr:flagellar hook capping FlgD N-terminal domain-containing protein [Paucimonas sp.]